MAAYGLLDIADKGRRAHHQASAPRHCSPASLPAIAAASLSAGSPTSAAASLALAPDLPLASLPTSASALFQQTAAGVAAACAACLPPPATYVTAAASSISEQPSSAVPVAAAVLDTALWHGAASLALPCLLINRCAWLAAGIGVGREMGGWGPAPCAGLPGREPVSLLHLLLACPADCSLPSSPLFSEPSRLHSPPLPAHLLRTVWATRLLLSTAAFKALPPRALVLAPSAVGLAIIPLAVPHIDEAVTEWMDRLRPHRPAQGISAVHSS